MSETDIPNSCQPPWVVFPDIAPAELSRYLKQGETEAWFDQQWRPFWSNLPEEDRQQYLQHWNASPAWRDAIDFYFEEDTEFDLEADAQESERYLNDWRKNKR